jgi:2-octaprenyl-6-methoxyphenol hydroxylase
MNYDAIVVGGGLSGGLCALALARAGLAVAVVDAVDPGAMREASFDGRTTAIAYASARLLRRVELWDAIGAEAEPIREILVTDGRPRSGRAPAAQSGIHLHFDSRELERGDPLGFIVENRVLRNAIFDAIAREPRAALFAPAEVARAVYGAGKAEAHLKDGRVIDAPLIVAADGRESPLRREAGVRTSRWSYPQTGIVATVAHERPHEGVAHEFFLPAGPFAILPMTGSRASLVWTERADAAAAYLALGEADFARAIEDRFGEFLGATQTAGPRWSYPLSFHFAHRFVAPRLALIGDAARAIHPIAGQGFNLGVKDIAALADVVESARSLGLDIGHLGALLPYERWRRFDSAALAFGTDALNRLFSNDFAPLRLARDLGLGAVNAIAPLRGFFMRQAGGDVGRLPPLIAP